MNTVTFTDDEITNLVIILETVRDSQIDECRRLETLVDENPLTTPSTKRLLKAQCKRCTEASMSAIRLLNKIWGRPSPASVFGGLQ